MTKALLAVAASGLFAFAGAGAATAAPLSASSPVEQVPLDGVEVVTPPSVDGEGTPPGEPPTLLPGDGVVAPRSANGCTLSNAGIGSTCIYVNGESNYVNYIRATIEVGPVLPPVVGPNICNRGYEFQYYRQGFTVPTTIVLDRTGCDLGVAGFQYTMTHHVNARLQDGSTACVRTRSNLSYGEWSPYACVDIRR